MENKKIAGILPVFYILVVLELFMPHKSYVERSFSTANELWDALSPTRSLFESVCRPIYRGQGDAAWPLLPSILRSAPATFFRSGGVTADDQVSEEILLLELFVSYCDQAGVRVPGDSIKFRNKFLSSSKQDLYIKDPSKWPSKELLEVMALAQHHGVPTRLLDWTVQPYIAAYFAASGALENNVNWSVGSRLAIWVLNRELLGLYKNVEIVDVPSAISGHLSAQSGLFTVHPHNGSRGREFDIVGLEKEFSSLPDTPLLKLSLPISECVNLFRLCEKAGINAATVYHSADGAGKAITDNRNEYASKVCIEKLFA